MTEASTRVPYDEFSMFHENAEEFGIPYDGPPQVRRGSVSLDDGRQLSALVWGESDPEFVLLHGGAQNAHTWDTVALALGRPLVAIDLPGHGHSDGYRSGLRNVGHNADDVANVIRTLAPQAKAVVGMSMGGITLLGLIERHPELVRRAVLVDVTPGVNAEKAKAITDFVRGPASFPDFDAILARTVEHNPTRSVSSMRRGILHNAEQQEDGSWVWRYARHRATEAAPAADGSAPVFVDLWDVVSALSMPLLLVRGMLPQSVVDDEDEAELLRRCPGARVEHVEGAGHSIQGDQPVELARLVADFVDG
jgi:pimeloyl-ACP methyl ester carboxylesterase